VFAITKAQDKKEEVVVKDNKDVEVVQNDEIFIAFARVFSGTIRRGQTIHVLGPKYDPHVAELQVCL